MDVQPTNLQQLCDAIMTIIMSIWTKISEECFQQLVEIHIDIIININNNCILIYYILYYI